MAKSKTKRAKKTNRSPRATKSGGQSKTAFVLGLEGVPAADVVTKAKAAGMTLSSAYVNTIRSNARRRAGQPARAKGRPGPKGSRSGSKTSFIMSQPAEASAADVVEAGKKLGMKLTAAYVYGIRSRMTRLARGRGGSRPGPGPSPIPPGGRARGGSPEDALVQAIIAVGTTRARQVLDHVEREVSRITAP